MVSRLAKKLSSMGGGRFVAASAEALRNKVLHLIYGFDLWHVTGNFNARPYKADVVRLIDGLAPKTVVEIGVGLGDILGRVHAEQRLGLDREAQVLKAARFCVTGDVAFDVADFSSPDQIIAACARRGITTIDVLVLVNWIHMIEMELIVKTLATVSHVIPIRHILMDTIRPGTQGYRFAHAQSDLERLGVIKKKIAADDVRDLVIVEVKQ